MLPEGGALPEGFGTVLTFVWSLSRMNPLMLNMIHPLAKGPCAYTIFIESLPCVDSLVLSKERLGAEGPLTLRASVAFLCEDTPRFHWDWYFWVAITSSGLYKVHVPKFFLLGPNFRG